MATTTRGRHAQYVEFDEYVDSKIVRTREAIRTTDVLSAVVSAAAAILGYLVLFVVLDHWIGLDFLPPLIRSVIGLSILGGTVAWAVYKIGLPHRRRITSLFVAREIETYENALEGSLLNLVDLQRADRKIDEPVMRSIEKRAAVGLSQADLDGTIDRRPLMRAAYTLLGLVIAACLYTLLTVSLGLKPIGPSLLRAFGATGTAPTRISFESVEIQVATDATFVAADTSPRVPARFQPQVKVTLNKAIEPHEHVTLFFTTADQRFVDQPLEMRPVEGSLRRVFPEFSATLLGENDQGLLQDLTFRIEAGDASTPDYTIHVSTAPSASVQSVDYRYPEYMRLAEETRDGGNIDGWDGTTVTINATASQPVRSARLVFSDTEDTNQRAEEYPMHVKDGTTLTVQWKLAFRDDDTDNYPRFYRIICQDEQGATDLHPTLYSLAIRPDMPPQVEIIQPRSDLERPSNAVVPLLVKASDPDFQLKHLTLRVELDGKQLVEHNRELFAGEQPSFGPTSVDFPLEPLGLQPGQVITYWVEARDNKMPLGNRANTAPKLNIRITAPVTPEEAEKQHKDDQKQQQEQAERENAMDDSEPKQNGERRPENEPKNTPPSEQPSEGENNAADDTGTGDSSKKSDANNESPEPSEPNADDPKNGGNNKKSSKPGSSDKPSAPDPTEPANSEQTSETGNDSQNPKKDNSDGKPGDSPDDTSNKKAPGNGEPDPDSEPLKTDGSDDDEALKRLRDFQNKNATKQAPADKQSTKPNDTNGETNKTNPDKQPGAKSAAPDSKSQKNDSPARPGSKDQKATDSSVGKKGDKPKSDPGTDPGSAPGSDPGKNGEKSKTGAKKQPSSTGKNQKPGDANNSASQKGDPKRPQNSKDKKNPGDGAAEPKNAKPAGDDKAKPTDKIGRPKTDTKTDAGNKNNTPASNGKKKGDNADPTTSQKSDDSKSAKGSQKGQKGNKSGNPKTGSQKGNKTGGKKPSGGKPNEKPASGPTNQPASKNGKGDSGNRVSEGTGGTGKRSGTQKQGDAPGTPTDKKTDTPNRPPDAESANPDFSKEAANLVLKRLEDEIKRGTVDPELLESLGWSKDDVRQFANRLRKHVDTPADDNSPGAQAQRRQFEELLKSVTIKSSGTKRTGRSQRLRTTDSINSQDVPVPLQFREAVKLYRRNLIRGRTKSAAPTRK